MIASGTKQPAGYLEVLNGDLTGHLFPLSDETVIGRLGEDLDSHIGKITLPDSSVSRRHARIFYDKGLLYIEDLKSTNGTFLNAFRLLANVPCRLKEGGNLQIGNTHLRYRPANKLSLTRPPTIGNESQQTGANVFDISMSITGANSPRPYDISMVFIDSDVGSPDVSLMLDASELINTIGRPEVDDTQKNAITLKRLQAMANISIQLSAETNRQVLFSKVLDFIFDLFPTAERAFIVLHDDESEDAETFIPTAASTRGSTGGEERLALSRSIVHEVMSQKRSVLSTDAGLDKRFDGNQSIAGLGIRSVMCVPMLIDNNVIGLIQVDTHSQVHSFTGEDLQIITGVASQVAIALKNFRLYEDIEQLFESFVTASVHAIEARDPSTAGHSFRVAEYTERLAIAVDRNEQHSLKHWRFSHEQLRELRYASLLHDFGKVGVRENVLVKGKKLYPGQMDLIEERFNFFQAKIEAQAYRELIEQHDELKPDEFRKKFSDIQQRLKQEGERLQGLLKTIQHANEPTIYENQLADEILSATEYKILGHNGESIALLTDLELEALSLATGSLTEDERKDIRSHVSHTYSFLQHIPWTGMLSSVPDIAHAHHEKLDGSGYPRGLKGDEIPIQSRIMTIADIFDALTSGDRPYKNSLDIEQALDILVDEGRQGKIESKLVDVFIESKSYQLLDVH